MIRKAKLKDAKAIADLVNFHAEQGRMLFRRTKEVAENIRDYFVVEAEGKIVGCVALHLYNENLSEIKALAVDPHQQKKGYGRMMLEKCMEEARNLEIPRIFALTYVPGLFEKFGFKKADKATLPEKIWKECIQCKKYEDCDEIRVIYASEK